MGKTIDYYIRFYQISSKDTQQKKIDQVEAFLQDKYFSSNSDLENSTNHKKYQQNHKEIQSFLFKQKDYQILAEIALRCYVSEQIYQTCNALASQYGEQHQFKSTDLYSFVLDDVLAGDKKHNFVSLNQLQPNQYKPLAHKILKTFDFSKGTLLSTWVSLLPHHPHR